MAKSRRRKDDGAIRLGARAERPTVEHVRERTAERGWFLPILLDVERVLWGRWDWWLSSVDAGRLPDGPIPQIPFSQPLDGSRTPSTRIMELPNGAALVEALGTASEARAHVAGVVERCLYGGSTRLGDIVEWLLWGFGSPRVERAPNVDDRAAVTLYHELQLERLVAFPIDWGSRLVEMAHGESYGKGSAWFPTPMNICVLLAQMTFGGADVDARDGRDSRLQTVHEPCCGTGAMLLAASNYSVRLSACDIDWLMCRLTELAGFLFMPWLVCGRLRDSEPEPGSGPSAGGEPEPERPDVAPEPAEVVAAATGGRRQLSLF